MSRVKEESEYTDDDKKDTYQLLFFNKTAFQSKMIPSFDLCQKDTGLSCDVSHADRRFHISDDSVKHCAVHGMRLE